jgi:hypothetical protein
MSTRDLPQPAVIPEINLDKYHKKIAKIAGTFLGREDHGIFTFSLELNYGYSSQGAGMYCLDGPSRLWAYEAPGHAPQRERQGSVAGMTMIMAVLDACGVDSWEKLKGRTVYALLADDSWSSPVLGLAPLPTESGRPMLFKAIVDRYEPDHS